MPGVSARYEKQLPISYEVTETVAGGQLVEARAASKVGVAAAGSVRCLGVATKDAMPAATSNTNTSIGGYPNIDLGVPTQYVAVAREGVWPLPYAAAAAFGDSLICAANGQVTPAGATPDARTIIGKCREPAGVASGAIGLVGLHLG